MIAWWNEDAWVFTKNGLTADERIFVQRSRLYNPVKAKRRQKRFGWAAVIAAILLAIGIGTLVVMFNYLHPPFDATLKVTAYSALCLFIVGFAFSFTFGVAWNDERFRNRRTEATLKRLEKGTCIAVIDKTNLFWNELTRHACWPHASKAMRLNSHIGAILTGMVEVTLTGRDLSASIKEGPEAVVQQARDFGDMLHRVYESHQATTPSK